MSDTPVTLCRCGSLGLHNCTFSTNMGETVRWDVAREALLIQARAEVERLRADGTIASLAVAIARAEKAEAELRRAEKFWASAQERAEKLESERDALLAKYKRLEWAVYETRTVYGPGRFVEMAEVMREIERRAALASEVKP